MTYTTCNKLTNCLGVNTTQITKRHPKYLKYFAAFEVKHTETLIHKYISNTFCTKELQITVVSIASRIFLSCIDKNNNGGL